MFPPVKHVLNKFMKRLPREELKRLGKDIAKKLVASDYKNKRVGDPTAELTEKQVVKIKKFVSDFLSRAVEKYEAHQKKKTSRDYAAPGQDAVDEDVRGDKTRADADASGGSTGDAPTPREEGKPGQTADSTTLSDADAESAGSQDRKRKREPALADSTDATPSESRDRKRLKDEETTPPPPPPPPPESAPEDELTEVERAFREQEEALVRENEEAQRLEDEANKSKMLEDAAEALRNDISLAA